MTPRAPVQIAEAAAGANDPMANGMKALRERFGLPTSTTANVEAVLNQRQSRKFFR